VKGNHDAAREQSREIYGAGGAIGSTVARAFGAEGARVFLSGRTLAPVEAVAPGDRRSGWIGRSCKGRCARRRCGRPARRSGSRGRRRDRRELQRHRNPRGAGHTADRTRTRRLRLSDQHVAIDPIPDGSRGGEAHGRQGRGVIITLTASPARLAIPGADGFGVACAAIEALTRTLAASSDRRESESSA
jgi:hypothetical protein